MIGCGYLGATHAACMAELGHEVLGVEIDDAKRAALTEGRAPFHEPGLDDLLSRHVATGRLRFTDSFEEAGGLRRPALPLRRDPAGRGRPRGGPVGR